MLVQKLILINWKRISRLVALSWVGAGISDHNSLEFYRKFPLWKFVVLQNFICQIRNVNTGIALPCNIKFVFEQVREFSKECDKSPVIIIGYCLISIFIISETFAKSNLSLNNLYSSRWFDIQHIGVHIPGILVQSKTIWVLQENKWAIFVG